MTDPSLPEKEPSPKDKGLIKDAKRNGLLQGLGLTAVYNAAAAGSYAMDVPEIAGVAIAFGVTLAAMGILSNSKINGTEKLREQASSKPVCHKISKAHHKMTGGGLVAGLVLMALIHFSLADNKAEKAPKDKNDKTHTEIKAEQPAAATTKAIYQYNPA